MGKKKKKHTRSAQGNTRHQPAKTARAGRAGRVFLIAGIIVAVLILGYFGYRYFTGKNEPAATPTPTSTPASTPIKEGKNMQWPNPPQMSIDQNKEYLATIKTNFGDVVVQLFPKDAPLAVNSFVFLARQGYYDGVKFHRVVKDFVIQGGDPTGTGGGGPGYRFADEKVTRDYVPGTLAMANSGSNTNGSQFFITLADLKSRLPKNYTIFGIVTKGFDIVQKIGEVSVKAGSSGEVSQPTVDVHIDSIVIEEK